MASSRKPPPDKRLADLLAFLKLHHLTGQHLLLGLSGGLDSRVLCHMLVQARKRLDFKLSAVHINHGISSNAAAWAGFCADICAQDEIPFEAVAVDVPRDSGLGLEAAARAERYSVLLNHEADAVVLAHHQDDQAETLMLQLLRGAGVKGLAAMGEISTQRSAVPQGDFLRGVSGQPKAILRPLLGVSRAQLLEYAQEHALQWIDDESNLDLTYDRNFLRHRIFPELEQRFPACRKTMARSASHLAEAAELLEEIAREDAVKVVSDGKLNLAELKQLSAPRAGNLLRYWMTETSGLSLSAARIEDIRSQLLEAKIDARVEIKLGSRMLRRKRGLAFIE
jgi:tRNA(Ile)-lysidine synthase